MSSPAVLDSINWRGLFMCGTCYIYKVASACHIYNCRQYKEY